MDGSTRVLAPASVLLIDATHHRAIASIVESKAAFRQFDPFRHASLARLLDLAAAPGSAPTPVIHANLPPAGLAEAALRRREGTLAANGAFVTATGERTGRSPQDKFAVRYPGSASEKAVWWGEVNQPLAPDRFASLVDRLSSHLLARDAVYVADATVAADPAYRLPVRVIAEEAWHALFARQLFRRDEVPAGNEAGHASEGYGAGSPATVLMAPHCYAVPVEDGTRSEAAVVMDLEHRLLLICGTRYAGELKKSVFSLLNYLLPQNNVLSMHCAANVGRGGDSALFFGLSGTGKTSLSADPARSLLGDDEHGWSDEGIFNLEGGCYAKCIRLSQEDEPQIWNAIRFGSVVENVVVDQATRQVDFDDDSITENTRAAYPVDHIEGALTAGVAGHPTTVLFLTADAFGVLPPLARLTTEQALYHFLSGYTARLAGTEAGLGSEPEATFSACFGAPFLPLPPSAYAQLLGERLAQHGSRCYLVNTGWTGGPHGVGHRLPIGATRSLVRAAIAGDLDRAGAAYWTDPLFGLQVPESCPGVSDELLRPRETWADPSTYDGQALRLARDFHANFAQFEGDPVARHLVAAGPSLG